MKWNISFRCLLVLSVLLSVVFPAQAQGIPCEYRLELFDNGGDGWNGANLVITINGEARSFTLNNIDDDGTFAVFPVTVNDGDTVSIRFLPGSANGEIFYAIFSPTGELVGADGPFPITGLVVQGIIRCPSCPPPPPNSIVVEDVSATTADIAYRLSDPDGSYLIEYGPDGFRPGTGTALVNSTGNLTLTGLAEKTKYDFYIAAACVNGDTSAVLGPFPFETLWTIDVGVSGLVKPQTGCALTSNEEVLVILKNFGADPQSLIPFKYNVNGVDANISMPQDGLYTGVLGKDSIDAAFPFDARWNFSRPQEYVITAWTELEEDRDKSNDTTQVTITNIPFVSEYPYFENFEVWKGGWTVGEDSRNASWAYGKPAGNAFNSAFSGNSAWVTNLRGLYNNNELSYLVSPCLDFSGFAEDPHISFFFNFLSENNFDLAWLESSIDGGETWSKVGLAGTGTNWYNDPEDNAWTGTAGIEGWSYATNILTGLAGQADIRLRFAFTSDQGVANEGMALDDIFIGTPLENDLVMVSANNAGVECGAPDDALTIVIGNYGQSILQRFRVSYQVNNGETVTEEITGLNLAPGEQTTYTFQSTFNSAPVGSYLVRAWTDFDDEIIRQNDTTSLFFTNALALPFAENFESPDGFRRWTADTDLSLGRGHGSTSTVLYDNLWNLDQTLRAVTPAIGPITLGDSLSFDYRFVGFNAPYPAQVLGPGDTLSIGVSLDCGVTFTTIFRVTAANHTPSTSMKRVRLSLKNYVGQAIKIGFFAQRRVAGDYYLDIDNVNVFQCRDLQLSAEVVNASSANASDGSVRVIPGQGLAPFTYKWSTGAITNTAAQLSAGAYSVTVTDRLGCSATLEATVDIGTATGEPAWFRTISLAPNPTTGHIQLRLPDAPATDLSVELLDMVGHLLRRHKLGPFNGKEMEMDLGPYPGGLYFVRIIADAQMKTLKVIKQ